MNQMLIWALCDGAGPQGTTKYSGSHNLAEYADYQELNNAICEELEIPGGWIIADVENLPDELARYNSLIPQSLFDVAREFEKMGEDEADAFAYFLSDICDTEDIRDNSGDDIIEDFRERFYGWHATPADFAQHLAIDCGWLQIPDELQFYIDWDAYARDLLITDFDEVHNNYFLRD